MSEALRVLVDIGLLVAVIGLGQQLGKEKMRSKVWRILAQDLGIEPDGAEATDQVSK